MIRLVQKPVSEVQSKIQKMMQNEPGIKEIFEDRLTRLFASNVSLLILDDDKEIGFIYLINENINGILYLDMGILEKYRGQGYGKKAIQKLIQICDGVIEEFIIGETKNTNTLANEMANNKAALVYSKGEFNYYIFPSTRKEEFENSEIFDSFKEHCGNVPTKRKIINDYYN